MKRILVVLLLLISLCLPAYAVTYVDTPTLKTDGIEGPIDSQWFDAVADAESATSNPFKPLSATGTKAIRMKGYTGVQFLAEYTAAMGTDPIIVAFGCKGSVCTQLKDVNGNSSWTLADKANSGTIADFDVTDATNYWTVPTEKIDALGSEFVIASVYTAGVSASGGIKIKVSRY